MGSIFLLLSAFLAALGGGLFCKGYVDYRQQRPQRFIVHRLALGWIAYLGGLYVGLLADGSAQLWNIVTVKLICIALMGLILLGVNAVMKDEHGADFMLSKYWVAFFFLIYTLTILGVDGHAGLNL